ncbi:G5 domain-containing protein [Exiguobacterium sp. B2(2022)]|uniref:G5 domain-containing protein n=1 Tax=Exiguobacterium sp. B2(2022) TaxID=2992755 RepID=UPI00237B3A76|nr:G5 domain-containing protein [Exiguobacterium sp. B2(2022)]MDE0564586.1 G5 domain-containing protein [Exiguobacterium sp. B2(2022)]
MKRYGMHLFILIGLVMLVTLPTIGLVNYLDASAESSTTYTETTVAGVDVSGMTKEEADVRLDNAIKDFNTMPFSVNLMDGTVIEIGKEVVTFDVPNTLDAITDEGEYPLLTAIDESKVEPYLEGQPVTMTMIAPALMEAASMLESTVALEQVAAESEVVASFTVSPTPAMQSTLDRMNGFEMAAGDIFSLKSFGEDFEALTTLGSSFYRMFAATPFAILERVPHETLPSGVELGYDTKVDARSNFAVQNREKSSYAILVLNEGNAVTVQLLGQPFESAYEARVEEVTSVSYQKVVRFSSSLPSGSSSVTQSGQSGQSGKLYRVKVTEEGETMELLGFDFYAPTPEIVTKSSVPLPPPEPVEPVIPTFPDEEVEEDPTFDDELNDDFEEPPVFEEDPADQEAVG